MSSTGRGAEREELDGYWTPPGCAKAIVERLVADDVLVHPGIGWHDALILEPSVGKGSFVRALHETTREELVVDACDLLRRPELDDLQFGTFYEQDFLTIEPPDYYDILIGNPPFNDAERHVRKALTLIDPDSGVLAFILRLSFLEGVDRQAKFWKEHPCQYIYVLDRRPSFSRRTKQAKDSKSGELLFNKDGSPKMITVKNDSAAYAVFVWSNAETPGVDVDLQSATPLRVHRGHEAVVRLLSWKE